MRVGIIGGSLGGVSAANVLERLGAEVTLFERGPDGFAHRGGGLGVSLPLAQKIAGPSPALPHLLHEQRRTWWMGHESEDQIKLTVTSYGALWSWLRGALRETRIEFNQSTSLAALQERGLDLILAADGGASTQRGLLTKVTRSYAGYVLWRGLVRAAHIDASMTARFHLANNGAQHFVAYAIPNHEGETSPREQLFNWGMYVVMPMDSLAQMQSSLGENAPHHLERTEVTLRAFEEWVRPSTQRWPDWVRHLIEKTRELGAIGPHPIYECAPPKLTDGKVALIGDAAHLASPITGSGARMAMEDALALGASLRGRTIDDALIDYERARLTTTRAVVQDGMSWGASLRENGAKTR